MPQTITTGYKALLEAANRDIETLSVEQAASLLGRDDVQFIDCLLYTSPSPRDGLLSRMPSSA